MDASSQTALDGRVLLMTVGTGDLARLEESLFVPLRKSIETDPCNCVVLLPSCVTKRLADELSKGIPDLDIRVHPLPEGAEDDADSAYSHFDEVLSAILREIPPERIEVDFTRGTKVMSAALVLSAARHFIPSVRYITGDRDGRGMVIAGTEQVRRVRTATVEGHRRLDLAHDLIRRGSFSAVRDVLPLPDATSTTGYPPNLINASHRIQAAADFYSAWDRLDYSCGSKLNVGSPPAEDWEDVWPTDSMREWTGLLAHEPDRTNHRAMAEWLRRLVVDLLANGERRVRQGQYEDALVRAYRVLELVGQARLFDHGLDSGALDPDHEAVKRLIEELAAKRDNPLSQSPSGKFQAGRLQSARLLRQCNDGFSSRLFQFESEALLRPTLRNNSVLVHGFKARAPGEESQLNQLFDSLDELIKEDGGSNVETMLRLARSLSFADR